jgi:hypothetical protein
MALIHRGVGGEAIQVAVAVDIPDPDAFAAPDDHVQRFVILGTILIFQIDVSRSLHSCLRREIMLVNRVILFYIYIII